MKRAVIFDLDGVLVDSERYYLDRRLEYLRRMGYESRYERDFIGYNERVIWEETVPFDEELRDWLRLGYRAFCRLNPIPYGELAVPEARPVIERIHELGLGLAVVSANRLEPLTSALDAIGVKEYFKKLVAFEQCRSHKPDPEGYLMALDALGVSPEETLIVEDSPAGILAARRAGVEVLAVRPKGYTLDQSKADAIIDRLDEVFNYL